VALSISVAADNGVPTMIYDVIVVGAGLSGSSAAIQLAAQGVTVLLLEQAHYPTHRLCGEFLSVEVLATFVQLGILDAVRKAGAHPIQEAYLTTSSGATFQRKLPGTALGLSRYQLDSILFKRARAVGADCRDRTTVRAITGTIREGFTVSTSQGDFRGQIVIGAFGKRSSLDRNLDRDFIRQRSPWVACKAHYGVHAGETELSNRIELHAFPGGYCGLSQIEAGEINVCWIAHEHILQSVTAAEERLTPAALFQNPILAERLRSMHRLRTAQSLAQISFAIKDKFEGDILMMGDAGGMITPLCGDGMAMALRSAEMAVPWVIKQLQGRLGQGEFQTQYERLWQHEFKTRLQLGRWMHTLFVQPSFANIGVRMGTLFPALGDWVIRSTRGEATKVERWETSPIALKENG
jgi:menaquinone-9 beta-reductase